MCGRVSEVRVMVDNSAVDCLMSMIPGGYHNLSHDRELSLWYYPGQREVGYRFSHSRKHIDCGIWIVGAHLSVIEVVKHRFARCCSQTRTDNNRDRNERFHLASILMSGFRRTAWT